MHVLGNVRDNRGVIPYNNVRAYALLQAYALLRKPRGCIHVGAWSLGQVFMTRDRLVGLFNTPTAVRRRQSYIPSAQSRTSTLVVYTCLPICDTSHPLLPDALRHQMPRSPQESDGGDLHFHVEGIPVSCLQLGPHFLFLSRIFWGGSGVLRTGDDDEKR